MEDVKEFKALVPVPQWTEICGRRGYGMAVCPMQGVLVTSNDNYLTVFALPQGGTSGVTMKYALGYFKFHDAHGPSGWMVFHGDRLSRRLIFTDAGQHAVHVMDVSTNTHCGYVAAPGTLRCPRGVAAHGSLVAVSCWTSYSVGDGSVHLFEGSDVAWAPLRVLARGLLKWPFGLRFEANGSALVVAEGRGCNAITRVNVEDGVFADHVARIWVGIEEGEGPLDVEQWHGGWLVSRSNKVQLVGKGGRTTLGDSVHHDRGRGVLCHPSALALVPGLGLVVREVHNDGRLMVFALPDTIAMASMTACRVGWLVAVGRGLLRRLMGGTLPADGAGDKRRHL